MMKAAVLQPAMPVVAIDAQAVQYLLHFRPMARAEYHLINNTCAPTDDQRRRLAEASEAVTRAAARRFVEEQQKLMQGGWRPGASQPDPRSIVENEYARAVEFLSPDQRERYRRERELRAAGRKQVFVDNIVAKLETDLVLTSQQREQLAASLSSHWSDAWGRSLDMLQNLDHFFPAIPDQFVAPFLTEKQKAVWARVPKNQGVSFGLGGGMMGDADPLEDADLAAARKAAEARDKEKK
jgi:hypothetical protein